MQKSVRIEKSGKSRKDSDRVGGSHEEGRRSTGTCRSGSRVADANLRRNGRNYDSDCGNNSAAVEHRGSNEKVNNASSKQKPLELLQLGELLKMPNDDVIKVLEQSSKNLMETIKTMKNTGTCKDFKMLTLLVIVVGEKLCVETALTEMRNALIAIVADVNFFSELKHFTMKLLLPPTKDKASHSSAGAISTDKSNLKPSSQLRVLSALCNFYSFVCSTMQNLASDYLLPNIVGAQATLLMLDSKYQLQSHSDAGSPSESVKELQERFIKLELELKEFHALKEQKRLEKSATAKATQKSQHTKLTESELELLYLMKPDDNFEKMSIVPTTAEILSEDQPFLRPNLVQGKYPSALTYLDVQFRLLREDFVAPLRESITDWLNNQLAYSSNKKKLPPGTIRFYYDVKLKKVDCFTQFTSFSMQFSTQNLKTINWEKSKRLLCGSLVLLTPDRYKTIYFATICRREEKQLVDGIVGIAWEGQRPDTFAGVTFLMVECEVYFEAYRHTLRALQLMAQTGPLGDEIPLFQKYRMAKYIVDMSTEQVPPPRYLQTTTRLMNFSVVLKCNASDISVLLSKSIQDAKDVRIAKAKKNEERRQLSAEIEKLRAEETKASSTKELECARSVSEREEHKKLLASKLKQLFTDDELKDYPSEPAKLPDRPRSEDQLIEYKRLLAVKLKPHDVPALSVSEWPTAIDLGMDEPQYSAFLSAITHELSIIQGPPGTGKTYIGLQIIKLMLSNPLLISSSPILIVCYTNHALDQFLEGILFIMESLGLDPLGNSKGDGSLVRVGGQSKVQALTEHSLKEQRERYKKYKLFDIDFLHSQEAAEETLKTLLRKRSKLKDMYRGLEDTAGVINFEQLSAILNDYWSRHYPTELRSFIKTLLPPELFRIFLESDIDEIYTNRAFYVDDSDDDIYDYEYDYHYSDRYKFGHVHSLESYYDRYENYYTTYSMRDYKLLKWLELDEASFDDNDLKHSEQILRRRFKNISISQSQSHFKKAVAKQGKIPAAECPIMLPAAEVTDASFKDIVEANRIIEEISMEDVNPTWRKKYLIPYLKTNEELDSKMYALGRAHLKLKRANERGDLSDHDFRYEKRTIKREIRQLKKKEAVACSFYYHPFVKVLVRALKHGRVKLEEVTPSMLKSAEDQISNSGRRRTYSRSHQKSDPDSDTVLEEITLSKKWAIYFHVIEQIKPFLLQEIMTTENQIIVAQEELAKINSIGDGLILEKSRVVGLTTTGAAKYNTLLRMMKSKIVIVEEAAEVLESHIVTSITEHCEHLILIGDHQQLRPSTVVYKLAKDYNLDISLFERLIKNNLSWHYLKTQHRMRPEICKLLVPAIYEDLENDASVVQYPEIRGFSKSLFFVTHNQHEVADSDSMTKSNDYEARFLVKLCRYIMQQEYEPSQITILVTYIGQMFLIKKLMNEETEACRSVRVTVVDNFQGEENDIILLSLVRSNAENRIGFLKTDNRICVALSRARHGMFIIGNMDCLTSNSKTWATINYELQSQESIGTDLLLKCQNHGHIINIKSPEDFELKVPDGGCTKPCPGILPNCNHSCRLNCHVRDQDHRQYECKYDCMRYCPRSEKHSCPHPCFKFPCPPCTVPMTWKLACGHIATLDCNIDHLTWPCTQIILKKLTCGHRKYLKCHIPSEQFVCDLLVSKTLGCGHVKELPCPTDISDYECLKVVDKDLPCGHHGKMECNMDPSKYTCEILTVKDLPCGHQMPVPCSVDGEIAECKTVVKDVMPVCNHEVFISCFSKTKPETWICPAICDTRLDCGHQCILKCHLRSDPDHVNYECKKQCTRVCEGNHPCKTKHPCYKSCDPCQVVGDKVLPCGHTATEVACHVNPKSVKCHEQCQRKLNSLDCPFEHDCLKKCYESCFPCVAIVEKLSKDCGHPMRVECHVKLGKTRCEQLVPCTVESPCGHSVKVPCRLRDTCTPEECLKYCQEPCLKKVGCSHPCKGNCSTCFQGRIHVKCREKCDHLLVCGHPCKSPCWSLCPPCEELCMSTDKDKHSVSNKKRISVVQEKLVENASLQKIMQGQVADELHLKPNSTFAFDFFRQYLENMTCVYKKVETKKSFRHERYLNKIDQCAFESLYQMVSWWTEAEGNVKPKQKPQPVPVSKETPKAGGNSIEFVGKRGRRGFPSSVVTLSAVSADTATAAVVKQDLSERCQHNLMAKYTFLFETIMTRELPLSAREIKDLDQEFDRVFDLFRLYQQQAVLDNPSLPIKKLKPKFIQHLRELKPYDEDMQAKFTGLFNQLESILKGSGGKLDKTERKKRDHLFKSIGYGV